MPPTAAVTERVLKAFACAAASFDGTMAVTVGGVARFDVTAMTIGRLVSSSDASPSGSPATVIMSTASRPCSRSPRSRVMVRWCWFSSSIDVMRTTATVLSGSIWAICVLAASMSGPPPQLVASSSASAAVPLGREKERPALPEMVALRVMSASVDGRAGHAIGILWCSWIV